MCAFVHVNKYWLRDDLSVSAGVLKLECLPSYGLKVDLVSNADTKSVNFAVLKFCFFHYTRCAERSFKNAVRFPIFHR